MEYVTGTTGDLERQHAAVPVAAIKCIGHQCNLEFLCDTEGADPVMMYCATCTRQMREDLAAIYDENNSEVQNSAVFNSSLTADDDEINVSDETDANNNDDVGADVAIGVVVDGADTDADFDLEVQSMEDISAALLSLVRAGNIKRGVTIKTGKMIVKIIYFNAK